MHPLSPSLLPSATSPHPQSLLQGGSGSREPRTQVPHLGDVTSGMCFWAVWLPCTCPSAPAPSPSFIVVVRQKAEWALPTGTCWGSCPPADTGGRCGWDRKSFIPRIRLGLERSSEVTFIYGDTEAGRDLSRAPRLDALIKQEEWGGDEEAWVQLFPRSSPP